MADLISLEKVEVSTIISFKTMEVRIPILPIEPSILNILKGVEASISLEEVEIRTTSYRNQ